MHAASLNFLDLAVAFGQYPGIVYPLVPVADGVGEIIAIGDGATGVALGDSGGPTSQSDVVLGRGSVEKGLGSPAVLRFPGS